MILKKSIVYILSIFVLVGLYSEAAEKNMDTDELDIRSDLYKQRLSTSSIGNIDYSVDDQRYLIGSGDEFSVIFSDMPLVYYSGIVNQNGDLFIPEIGIIPLGKVTLEDAKKKITELFSKKLKKSGIYVSLKKVKIATISVSGNVLSPGTYQQPGFLRLMDVIAAANKDHLPSLNDCDYRNVVCTNQDSVLKYDLFKYIMTGDLQQNPYIYPGDNITLELPTRKVFITGAIKSIVSGAIPIKIGEKLGSFLSFFTLDASADSGKVILQTSEGKNRKTLNLVLPQDSEISLNDRDMIIIPAKENYSEISTVSVSGEVGRTGTYPFSKGITTAKEILASAGNANQYGNLDRAVVIRRGKIVPKELTMAPATFDSKINTIRPEMSTSMSMMSISNDFTIIPVKKEKILLQSGDEIFVPKKEYYVYVSGGVKNPGGYKYKEGVSKRDYIKDAGGFSRKADKSNIYVVTRYSDVLQTTDGKTIQEGDIVVVPISQQNKLLSTVIIPIVQAVATTIGVFLAIYATVK